MKTYKTSSSLRIGCLALITGLSGFGLAGNSLADTAPNSVDCLQVTDIRNTDIVDDQNIIFKTRNNKFYNNHLPNKCAGLKAADKFRYKTSLSKLCNVDMITVLQGSGSSMMDGATCGLGRFTETADPAEAKKAKSS